MKKGISVMKTKKNGLLCPILTFPLCMEMITLSKGGR